MRAGRYTPIEIVVDEHRRIYSATRRVKPKSAKSLGSSVKKGKSRSVNGRNGSPKAPPNIENLQIDECDAPNKRMTTDYQKMIKL